MDNVHLLDRRIVAVYSTLVVLFVLTPLVCIVFVSLSAAQFISFPWDQGFSFRWYAEIPEQAAFIEGAKNSLKLAGLTALIAGVIGSLASLAIVRQSFPGRSIVVLLGSSSLFVPEVLFGLALVLAISQWQLGDPLLQLLIGHVVITIPFVLRVTTAALTDFNLDQEYAAQNLGAGRLRAFASVTFPQIRSGIFAAALMAFIVSFDNIALSLFLAGPGYQLLPVALYAYAVNSFDGIAAAVSVLMIVISLVVIWVLDKTVGLDKLFGGTSSDPLRRPVQGKGGAPVLSVSVSLRIQEGRAADFLTALGQARTSALADEPGCLQFDIGRDVDDPEVFHLYEVYRDEAALAEHRTSPHFERWRQASGDLLAEGGRTTRLSELVAFGHDEPTEVSS